MGHKFAVAAFKTFFTQSPSEKTRFKVLSPRSNASDKRGVSLWTKYIMARKTLQELGTPWVIQKQIYVSSLEVGTWYKMGKASKKCFYIMFWKTTMFICGSFVNRCSSSAHI